MVRRAKRLKLFLPRVTVQMESYTLETLRFGNTKVILETIVNSIQDLRNIDSGEIDLVEFASK